MHFNKTYSYYHRLVALAEFGLYNWKKHSTGYLLKELRGSSRNGYYDDIYPEENTYNKTSTFYENGFTDNYWRREWNNKIKEELAKRPHLSTKAERKAKQKSS